MHGGPSDEASDAALTRAERYAAQLLDAQDLAAIPQVAQWREAFRAFGVRPRSATSSLESLLRRAAAGLPRIDRLTDHYNAISIAHLVPFGGEDLDAYAGAPHLVVADGSESFDAIEGGEIERDRATGRLDLSVGGVEIRCAHCQNRPGDHSAQSGLDPGRDMIAPLMPGSPSGPVVTPK